VGRRAPADDRLAPGSTARRPLGGRVRFKDASAATLDANDPTLLARGDAAALRRDGMRFFLSTGPGHSHWFTPAETLAFARELRSLRLPFELRTYAVAKGEWRAQVDAGLTWALAA
jgi:hypothetical protein